MRQAFLAAALLAARVAGAQEPAKLPSFEIADVHPSPKGEPFRMGGARGRYEVRNITLLNLIGSAYGLTFDQMLGGPPWIQMDRFDITAKVPPDTSVETQELMLQSLLAERFGLKIHHETKGMPAYALVLGKKPLLREGDASDEPGCKAHTIPSPKNGENPNTILEGPGATITYTCRNMSMDGFANHLPHLFFAELSYRVFNETGLKGNWDFDLTYSVRSSLGIPGDEGARIPIAEAVEKQLGLKLQPRQAPIDVIVVDSVRRTPAPNPAGVAEALPPIVLPTEFDVASIKPSEPVEGPRRERSQMQPSGRYISDGSSLRALIDRAFNAANSEQIQNVPAFAQSDRYDITAKVTLPAGYIQPDNSELIAPLIRSLLVNRFKMTYHTENREVTAYALAAGKPKMKKADPASRTHCSSPLIGPPGTPPGTLQIICQNATMAQFADQLLYVGQDIIWPVEDKTGIEGAWDFTLTYMSNRMIAMSVNRGGDAGPGHQAADPTGGLTIFEAIEKQLGLKLEKVKRKEPVIVIDHLEQKPAAN